MPVMPRIPRPVFAGIPHHITQRSNRRENVFFTDGDRAAYLGWLAHYCAQFGVQVLAYCLMTTIFTLLPSRPARTRWRKHCGHCTRAMLSGSRERAVGAGMCGRAGSFHPRWTLDTYGPLASRCNQRRMVGPGKPIPNAILLGEKRCAS